MSDQSDSSSSFVGVPQINWKALKRIEDFNPLIDTYGQDILYTADETGLFPIHWAVVNGNLEIVDKIIKAGVSPRMKARIYDEPEPIHLAALEGNIQVIDLLLSKGIDIDVKDRTGSTPLMRASMFGRNYRTKSSETVLRLISCGADINQTDSDGLNCLHYAVIHHNEETVHLLLNIGLDPNQITNRGYRAIDYAIKNGDKYLMKLLGPLTDGISESDLKILIFKHKKKRMSEKFTKNLLLMARIVLFLAVFSVIFYAYPQYAFYYWPKTSSNIAIHSILIVLHCLVWFWWYKTCRTEPGYLPLNTHEYVKTLQKIVNSGLRAQASNRSIVDFKGDIRLCHTCRTVQSHRSTHCRFCKRCIAGFDHHCIYLSTCVGQNNRLSFFSLGLSLFLMGLVSTYLVVSLALTEDSLLTPYQWFNTCYCFQFLTIGFILTVCNLRRAAINLTQNEEIKSRRYSYLTDSEGRFVNPFDRGSYLKNIIDYFTAKQYNYSKFNTFEC